MGRPPIGDRAMTDAERQRLRRERLAQAKRPTPANAATEAAKPAAASPAATRQYQRKLDLEFDLRVQAEIKKLIDEMVLPAYREEAAMHDLIIKRRKGVFPKETYRLILSVLHPDNSASKERRNEAFNAVKAAEKLLLDEKQSPTPKSDLPTSYADLMERKRKKAKR